MLPARDALVLVVLCYLISHMSCADDNKGKDTQNCGLSSASSTSKASSIRNIQARVAEKGAWPWMTEVYRIIGNKRQPTCGGALVTNSYVVTAAHCVIHRGTVLNPNELIVRLGAHNITSNKDGMSPVDVNVTSVHAHEEFDPRTLNNDIALLRLAHPVNFTKHIQPICLPYGTLADEDLTSKTAYIAGWGSTSFGGPTSDVLQEMSATITGDETCRDAYSKLITIMDTNICTVGINGSSPCQGFGGSPVVLPGKDNRYYFVGITSFGRGCGDPDFPDVHTKVAAFMDWLDEYLK